MTEAITQWIVTFDATKMKRSLVSRLFAQVHSHSCRHTRTYLLFYSTKYEVEQICRHSALLIWYEANLDKIASIRIA